MRRRDFITLLGSAAAAWPLAARAQQPAVPVVGYLNSQSPEAFAEPMRGFRQGLKDTGYVDGENIAIEYRWAENQIDRVPGLAAELVRRRVTVIVTGGGPAVALAAKAATTAIPIVFNIADDPVSLGLVASLARPGGSMTGVSLLSTELTAKRLELLRELVPGAIRVAVLANPSNPTADVTVRKLEAAAQAVGLQIQVLRASTSREIDAASATVFRERPDALFVTADPFFNSRRIQLVLLAAFHRLPATYSLRDSAEAGGLMSYAADLDDLTRRAAVYIDKNSQGEQTSRPPRRASVQIPASHQPQDRQGVGPRSPVHAARSC